MHHIQRAGHATTAAAVRSAPQSQRPAAAQPLRADHRTAVASRRPVSPAESTRQAGGHWFEPSTAHGRGPGDGAILVTGASSRQVRTINSASRVRFCPPPQRTFGVPPCGFFLRPTGVDSTYSRPVLAARGNLGVTGSSVKGNDGALPEIAVLSARTARRQRECGNARHPLSRVQGALVGSMPVERCRVV